MVAEVGNLTRASQRVHTSVAAASARIKALEIQAGVPLFYREARGIRLTPAGEAFLHHTRGILRQTEQMRVDLHEYGKGLRGHVRVFANTTAFTDFLPEILSAFLVANPRVNIDLQEKPNTDIARGVFDGRADVGIVAGKVDMLDLEEIHFSTDKLVLVTSRHHRFSKRSVIAYSEILEEDAVAMHQGSTLQMFLAGEAEKLSKPAKLRIQVSNFDSMCRMIGAGVGVGIVPESTARRNLEPMKLAQIELADPWSVRERYILVRKGESLSAYSLALIDAICGHYGIVPPKIG